MKTKAKKMIYKIMVGDLLEKNQNQWHSQYKRLTNQGKTDQIIVDEISHLPDKDQAEMIADHVSAVSQEYDHLKTDDIEVPVFDKLSTLHISQAEVKDKLMLIKTKKSTAPGDVPAKLIKIAADHLAAPLTDGLNAAIHRGEWPNIYKVGTITPAPKVRPTKLLDDLRPITNLFTYCKIGEKIICDLIVEDMVKKMDPSQFGNLKNTSIQHYLVSLINRISSALDRNSRGDIFAACVTFYDYQKAFSRQCHRRGVLSFIRNGV